MITNISTPTNIKITTFDDLFKASKNSKELKSAILKKFKMYYDDILFYGGKTFLESIYISNEVCLKYRLLIIPTTINQINNVLKDDYFHSTSSSDFPVYVNFIKPYLEYKALEKDANKYNL